VGATRRWKSKIKTDVKKTECEDVNWIHLVHDRVQWQAPLNMVMKFRVL
jgi:hypothetical protein